MVVKPLGWSWDRHIVPKKSVIDSRGRVVHKPSSKVLEAADVNTSRLDVVRVKPGTMWDTLGGLFGKPAEGQSMQSFIQTPQHFRLHGQFIRHREGSGATLHHLHLSPMGKKLTTHVDRFVLGRERSLNGRKWVEVHPMHITPDGLLEVELDNFILMQGTRRGLEASLSAALKEQPKPTRHFRAIVDRLLTGRWPGRKKS